MKTTRTITRFANLIAPTKSLLMSAAVLSIFGLGSFSSATAAPVTIQNWSFETPVVPTNGVGGWGGPTVGWFAPVGDLGLLLNGTGSPYILPGPQPNGAQNVALFTGNSFAQTLNFAEAGLYELTFYVAGRANPEGGFEGNLPYEVSVGGVSIYTGMTLTNQPWAPITQQFTIATAGDFTLQFLATAPQGFDRTAYFDAIQIQSIPEPSTVALMGISLFAISFLARRKMRA